MACTQNLVLFTDYTDLDPEPARKILAQEGISTELLRVNADGTVDSSQAGAVALIVGYADVTEQLMEQLPNLGCITTTSNGVDMVDTGYAQKNGIWVCNVPHAATQEVAVHTVALILAALRHLRHSQEIGSQGGWTAEVREVPKRVSQLTLGLLGFGKIGAEVARLATPFFERIVVNDSGLIPSSETGVLSATFGEVIATADVISLHLPLTDVTRHIVNAEVIAQMKHGITLINVSRGELVDQGALHAALDSGQIEYACLDVLDREPPATDHPFRSHPRVILTPHVAFLSDAALQQYEEDPAHTVASWWNTGAPNHSVIEGTRAPQHSALDTTH